MEKHQAVEGEILEKESKITLNELCLICDTSAEYILELVDYGVLEPLGKNPIYWEFTFLDLNKCKRALRLRHDFDINLPGLALSVELLEEVEALRDKVEKLEHKLMVLGKIVP